MRRRRRDGPPACGRGGTSRWPRSTAATTEGSRTHCSASFQATTGWSTARYPARAGSSENARSTTSVNEPVRGGDGGRLVHVERTPAEPDEPEQRRRAPGRGTATLVERRRRAARPRRPIRPRRPGVGRSTHPHRGYRAIGGRPRAVAASDPAPPAEDRRAARGRRRRSAPTRPPASSTGRRTPGEVLAVEPDDEARHEHERCDHRELLRDVVLLLGDLGLVVVADAGEQVAGDVELLRPRTSVSYVSTNSARPRAGRARSRRCRPGRRRCVARSRASRSQSAARGAARAAARRPCAGLRARTAARPRSRGRRSARRGRRGARGRRRRRRRRPRGRPRRRGAPASTRAATPSTGPASPSAPDLRTVTTASGSRGCRARGSSTRPRGSAARVVRARPGRSPRASRAAAARHARPRRRASISIASGSSRTATALRASPPASGRPGRSTCVATAPRLATLADAGRRCQQARGRGQRGVALLAQPPLRVERGRAPGAGGGDGLAVDVVLDVAGGEDARDVRLRRLAPVTR